MSDSFYDDTDDYGQEQSSGPKALRDKLAKEQKAREEAEAKLAEIVEQNKELAKKVQTSSLRDALTDAGIDPKYAKFAERDGVEPTEEKVREWVEEYSDVYAFLKKQPEQTAATDGAADDGSDEVSEHNVDALPEDLIAGLAQAQTLESAGRPSGSASIEDILTAVDPTKVNETQIQQLLKQLGAPTAYDG